ncbi:MAG: OmpA family protein [Alphaproteobacteria bacterium]|nr:OmpA family protein [Alphaproteobacteria bacterium]
MTNRFLLGAGIALAVAFGGAQAHAQWWPTGAPGYWYIGPEGGWTSLTSQSASTSRVQYGGGIPGGTTLFTTPGFNATPNTDSGFNVGARGGYQWGPWRLEEEYGYRRNSLSNNQSFNILGPFGNTFTTNGGRTQGQVHSNAIMTNVIYDFTLGWPITPHIGAGVGAVDVSESLSINSFTLRNPIGPPISPATPLSVGPGGTTFGGTLLSGSSWRFGYQGIAGIRYDFSPTVAFDLDYRYLGTPSETIRNNSSARYPFPNGNVFVNGQNVNCCAGGSFTSKYNSNNLVASITMKFGAPPAPPPPLPPAPPPPPPQKVFLVFFDWDKYNITPEGERIIELAAQQYKAGGSVKIQVNGYTDTTGSFGYNQRLSERRANAVAGRLAALGVARSDMAVAGHSFNDLRVPTPPGVREPQNRRVEIVFPT